MSLERPPGRRGGQSVFALARIRPTLDATIDDRYKQWWNATLSSPVPVLLVGIGQVISAVAVGFGLLLKAQRRGSAVFVTNTVPSAAGLELASVFAAACGVTGAAWGLFESSVVGTATMTASLSVRWERPSFPFPTFARSR